MFASLFEQRMYTLDYFSSPVRELKVHVSLSGQWSLKVMTPWHESFQILQIYYPL